jgi:hypothetical protein
VNNSFAKGENLQVCLFGGVTTNCGRLACFTFWVKCETSMSGDRESRRHRYLVGSIGSVMFPNRGPSATFTPSSDPWRLCHLCQKPIQPDEEEMDVLRQSSKDPPDVWKHPLCGFWATQKWQEEQYGHKSGFRRNNELKRAVGKCAHCGISTESYPLHRFEWNHRDPRTKIANVSALLICDYLCTEEHIQAELALCELVCKPCHIVATREGGHVVLGKRRNAEQLREYDALIDAFCKQLKPKQLTLAFITQLAAAQ